MKLPISKRLLACAAFVEPGQRVADVGTDHGYLAVHLLRAGVCPFVTAADLREQPLQKAREYAARFGVSEKMRFFLSDGLQGIPPDAADTIIMAGMGGDLMVRILEAAPWVCDARYTLILQPQSAGQALRQYLAGHGVLIEREALAQDGHFLYTVLRAKKGTMPPLTPGQQYATPQLLAEEIAQDTGYSKISGYCEYPLWVFKEDFLKEIGGYKYERYSVQFDAYMRTNVQEDDTKMDEMQGW